MIRPWLENGDLASQEWQDVRWGRRRKRRNGETRLREARVTAITLVISRILTGETGETGKSGRVGLLISGGADMDILDFLAEDFRAELSRLTFGARTGEEDSFPDWKMLLSSHPESIVPGPN